MTSNLLNGMNTASSALAKLAECFTGLGDHNNAYTASNASGVFKSAISKIEQQNDTIDGLRSELEDAVACLFHRGAKEYVRTNYPEQYKKLTQGAANGQ